MLAYIRHGLGDYFKQNIVKYFFVTLVFLIGIVVGAMAVKLLPDGQKSELINYLNIFFSEIAGSAGGSPELLSSVIFGYLKMMAFVWLLGFTIIGIPFVLFIVFTRGFIIGFTVGFLVNEYVAKGLLFALVSVLPHNFFAAPILIAASVVAIHFSIRLIKRRKQPQSKLWTDALNYSAICMILSVGMIFASFVEVYVSPVFMRLAAKLLVS